MQKTDSPPSACAPIQLDQIVGGETGESLSPLERSLASSKTALRSLGKSLDDLVPLWNAVVESCSRQEIARTGLLSQEARELALQHLASSTYSRSRIFDQAQQAEVGERFLINPVLEELDALEWGWTVSQNLQSKAQQLTESTMAAVSRLQSRRSAELEFLHPLVDKFWLDWSGWQKLAPAENQFQLCCAWAESFAAGLECGFHDWRVLLEALQMATTIHLCSHHSFGLNSQLQRLALAIPRFEFAALLTRRASLYAARVSERLGPDFLRACVGEMLQSPGSGGQPSPLIGQVFLADKPWSGLTLAEFKDLAAQMIEPFRPLCERSWLDWLQQTLQSLQGALRWREARARDGGGWDQISRAAAANLSEALDFYRKNSGAGHDLQYVFEAASQAPLLTTNPAQARALYRKWFVGIYGVREAQGAWLQPRALVKAVQTQLNNGSQDELIGLVQAASNLLDTIPALMDSCASIRQLAARSKPAALLLGSPRSQACLSFGAEELIEWMARFLQYRGGEALLAEGDWPAVELLELETASEQAAYICLLAEFESRQEFWMRGRLAARLWSQNQEMAAATAQKVYARLSDYAKESGLEGPQKCARDQSSLLRRVTWSLLASEGGMDALADWWREFVDAYLVNRHHQLLPATLEGLLESAQGLLPSAELELLEPYLRMVLASTEKQPAEDSQEDSRPQFQPLNYVYPLADMKWGQGRGPLALDWDQGAAYSQRFGATLSAPELASVRPILGEGWAHYLWAGYLEPRFCRQLKRWLEETKDRHLAFERLLVGCMFHSSSEDEGLARLDYLQAVQEFQRQCSAGLELQELTPKLADWIASKLQQSPPNPAKYQRDIGLWLGQLAQSLTTWPHALAAQEFRRYLVDCPAFTSPEAVPLWRQVWNHLASLPSELALSPGLTRQLQAWSAHMLEVSARLPAVGSKSARYSNSQAPIFSANPQEERQWRQLLGSLFALQLAPAADAGQILLVVVESLPLIRSHDFSEKMEKVGQLFWEHEGCQELAALSQARARHSALGARAQGLEARRSGLRAAHPEWHRLSDDSLNLWLMDVARFQEGIEGGWCASRWGVPQLLKSLPVDVWNWPQADLLKLEPDLGAKLLPHLKISQIPRPVLALHSNYDQERCSRDLGWLHKRLAVDSAALDLGARLPTALDWFAWEVAPYAESIVAAEHIAAIGSLVAASQQPGSAGLGLSCLQFWSRCLPLLRAEEVESRAGAYLRGCSPGSEPHWLLLATSEKLSPPVEMAVSNWLPAALAYSQKFSQASALSQPQAELTVRLLEEEMGSFEELGYPSSRLALFLGGPRQENHLSALERFLVGLIYSAGDSRESGLGQRLRWIDYGQACIELVRQIRLGQEVSAQAAPLARLLAQKLKSLIAQDKLTRDLTDLLKALGDCWQTAPRPLAFLNCLRYLVEQVAPSTDYSETIWNQIWRALQEVAVGLLSGDSQRELSWWTSRLPQSTATLQSTGVIARALQTRFPANLDCPAGSWRSLLGALLALRHLQDTQLPWLPAVRRAVAIHFDEGLLERRQDDLQKAWTWLQDSFIEFDLGPLEKEIAQLRSGWDISQKLVGLQESQDFLVARLLERVPAAAQLQPAQLGQLLRGLVNIEWGGDGASSRWGLPACSRLLPEKAARDLAGLGIEQCERLQAALINLLGRYVTASRADQEISKLFDLASRMGELEQAWDQPLVAADPKAFSDTFRRDLQWLSRRICLEGWLGGSSFNAAGSLSWYRWEVVPYAGDTQVKPFLKAVLTVAETMEGSSHLTQAMKRCADEFRRGMELRLDRGTGKQTVWELMSLPVNGAAPRASKPDKRSWWGRLTESFEGLVSGQRKED